MKKGFIFVVVAMIAGVAIYFYMGSKGDGGMRHNDPETYLEYKNNMDWRGGETDPIVPAFYFTGMASAAYTAAAAIPDVLDHLYCYCYCAEHAGHKSLRSCFTDGHGAECDICMKEALLAKQLHDEGYSIKDIREEIDTQFYRPYK